MRALIIGCGYVGLRVGRELAQQDHEVFGLRRSDSSDAELKEAGIQPVHSDLTNPGDLENLPGPFDWVVNVASSSHGDESDYRRIYLEGNQNVLQWLSKSPPKKYVYTSSTSVYGQSKGELVKEDHDTEPATPTGKVLVETEQLIRQLSKEHNIPSVILRVSGIYGPDRGYAFKQFLKNETRIPGKGLRHINMIHVDDVAGAIVAALKSGRAGETYNATDDEPVAQVHFYRWLSETLGKWMPPFVPEEEMKDRKRGMSDKKISNRRLKMELGYQFKYSNFRKGYTAIIKALTDAGELNIEPEDR